MTTPFGLLAQFESAQTIYKACEKVRDKGFKNWDSHTPFPVHGLDKAMGLKASKLPWIVLVMALTGTCAGMGLQWWISAVDYPLVISGKPYFSWPAFIPVTFEITVLLGSFGAVFGMFFLNRLPLWYHALFQSDAFAKVTDDKFFISIEAKDPLFDATKTKLWLQEIGASHVEMVNE